MPPKPNSSDSTPRHVGTILWIYKAGDEDRGEVTEAIFRTAREIAIDCRCEDCSYTIVLKSTDGVEFTGACRGRCDGQTWQPAVRFNLWTSHKGYLLFGDWLEDGDESYCAIELHEMNSRTRRPS
jgi:hypothetical protein